MIQLIIGFSHVVVTNFRCEDHFYKYYDQEILKKIKSKGFAYHIAIIYKINMTLDVGKGYLRNLFLVAIVLQAFCRNRPEITPARFIRYKARLGIKRWKTKNLIFHLKIGS